MLGRALDCGPEVPLLEGGFVLLNERVIETVIYGGGNGLGPHFASFLAQENGAVSPLGASYHRGSLEKGNGE